ncbi:hypothetical protein, partial [Maribellus maritimus]|uniref:hypothetical protein n=1 Tax=Maribellus maritimus TaxID=2870838 RepID=UPI001EEA4F4C
YSETASSITVAEFEALGGTATDNCNVFTITYHDVSDGLDCPETITRTYTVTDDCENTTICTQIITLNDYTLPSFTVPEDITIYKDDDCNYDASSGITGEVTDLSDNCTVASLLVVTSTEVNSAGACDDEIIITRTWTVTDECGNDSSQVQIITVSDSIRPVISCPPLDSIEACDISEFNTQVTFPYSETASSITVAEF